MILKAVGKIAAGAGGSQALALAAAPFLTRFYSPEMYGNLAVFSSMLAFLLVVASLRYELAIPLPEDDATADSLTRLCLRITVGLTLFSTVIVTTTWALWSEAVTVAVGSVVVWLMLPFGLLGGGIYQILSYRAIRDRLYGAIARTKLLQGAACVTIQLAFGLIHPTPVGLILGQIISVSAGSFALRRQLRRLPHAVEKSASPMQLARIGRRYSQFPTLSAPAGLFSAVGLNAPPLILATYYGSDIAGLFFLAHRVVGLPLQLISTSVHQVYVGEAAVAVRNGQSLSPLFWGLARKLATASVAIAVALYTLADVSFGYIFGAPWAEAGVFAAALAPYFMFRFVATALFGTLAVLERQGLALILQFCIAAGATTSLSVAGVKGLAPENAISVYGLTMACIYVLIFGVPAFLVNRKNID